MMLWTIVMTMPTMMMMQNSNPNQMGWTKAI